MKNILISDLLKGILLVCTLMLLQACEEFDDGSFTPQVIIEPEAPVDTTFTVEDPCLTSSCALQTMTVNAGSANLTMDVFASFDFMRDSAVWGAIKSAVIVVHGNNRNGNEYFNWMSNAINSIGKANETLIIAPQFKTSADVASGSEELIYSSDGWKRGFQSNNITSEKMRFQPQIEDDIINYWSRSS